MAKRPVEKYDFKAFGEAIKAARTGRKESRKQVSDEMYISPRYLANIENKGHLTISKGNDETPVSRKTIFLPPTVHSDTVHRARCCRPMVVDHDHANGG